MENISAPELKGLFLECPRLKTKLSSQEFRAMHNFIQKMVKQEYADLLLQISRLEMELASSERKYTLIISELKKEAEETKNIAREYRQSFGNISRLLTNKEGQFEIKYENLLKEMELLGEDLKKNRKSKILLETDNEKKDALIGDLHSDITRLKQAAAEKADYETVVRESTRLHRENLRLKVDLDIQKNDNAGLLRDMDRMRDALKSGASYVDAPTKKADAIQLYNPVTPFRKHYLKDNETELPLIPTQTMKPNSITYYCAPHDCRARRDLEDCRTQLARKCQENTQLSYLLAQAQTKLPELGGNGPYYLDHYRPRQLSNKSSVRFHRTRSLTRDGGTDDRNTSRLSSLGFLKPRTE